MRFQERIKGSKRVSQVIIAALVSLIASLLSQSVAHALPWEAPPDCATSAVELHDLNRPVTRALNKLMNTEQNGIDLLNGDWALQVPTQARVSDTDDLKRVIKFHSETQPLTGDWVTGYTLNGQPLAIGADLRICAKGADKIVIQLTVHQEKCESDSELLKISSVKKSLGCNNTSSTLRRENGQLLIHPNTPLAMIPGIPSWFPLERVAK